MTFVYSTNYTSGSSAISELFYSHSRKEMAVYFHSGIAVIYKNFNEGDWRYMTSALSLGSYYNSYVKGNSNHSPENMGYVNRSFFVEEDIHEGETEAKTLEAEFGPNVEITVNIYVNGNPDDVARAVERLAPSFRHIKMNGGVSKF